MNPATQLLAVKSYAAAQEAGARHDADLLDRLARLKSDRSPATDALTSARQAVSLDAVIDAALGRRGAAEPVAPTPLSDAIDRARQDIGWPHGQASKSAPTAPPTSDNLDARVRAMQRPAGDPNFAAGAVLGGVLGARRAPSVGGREYVSGRSMTLVDLDENLRLAQAEAKRTAEAARVAAEQLIKAEAAVEAYDRQREDRDGSPDAAA